MNFSNLDWKAVVGAIGFAGLALYQFSTGDISGGFQSVLAAVAAFTVKQSIDNNNNLLQMHRQQLLAMKKDGCCDDKCPCDEKK